MFPCIVPTDTESKTVIYKISFFSYGVVSKLTKADCTVTLKMIMTTYRLQILSNLQRFTRLNTDTRLEFGQQVILIS